MSTRQKRVKIELALLSVISLAVFIAVTVAAVTDAPVWESSTALGLLWLVSLFAGVGCAIASCRIDDDSHEHLASVIVGIREEWNPRTTRGQ